MKKNIKIKLILALIFIAIITMLFNSSSYASAVWDGDTWYWDIAALTTYDATNNTPVSENGKRPTLPGTYYNLNYLIGPEGLNDAKEAMMNSGKSWLSSQWGYESDFNLAYSFPNVSCVHFNQTMGTRGKKERCLQATRNS